MKNSYKISVLFIVVLCFGAQDVMAQSIFPDKNLEKVVRRYVFAKRNNEEPLTEQDVENISSIEGSGVEITDLTGLEKCRSLALLALSGNQITDISPLNALIGLSHLNLDNNRITDIKPLANLTNLIMLFLPALDDFSLRRNATLVIVSLFNGADSENGVCFGLRHL